MNHTELDMLVTEDRELPNCDSHRVTLRMSRDQAIMVFHDINRLLSLLDRASASSDAHDHDAYNRTNSFIAQLQRELDIDPDAMAG